MEIIQPSRHEDIEERYRSFDYTDNPGSGFSFPCDERGNAIQRNPAAASNYTACLTGTVNGKPVIDAGVQIRRWTVRHPAIGRCICRRKVCLDSFTNTCDCGRDYNMSGQLLAPRNQWGEETGEHWSECY